jgi:hypothetical protein
MWKEEKVVTINTDEIIRNAYKKGVRAECLKTKAPPL